MTDSEGNLLSQASDRDIRQVAESFGFAIETTSNPSSFVVREPNGKSWMCGPCWPSSRGSNWFNPSGRQILSIGEQRTQFGPDGLDDRQRGMRDALLGVKV